MSDPAPREELVERWLEGGLALADREQLMQQIAEPEAQADARMQVALHWTCVEALRSDAEVASAWSVCSSALSPSRKVRIGEEVQRRIRPRLPWRGAWAALAACLVLGLGWWWSERNALAPITAPSPVATLHSATADVQVLRAGQLIGITAGMALLAQDAIKVRDAAGGAEVLYQDRTRVAVQAATSIRLWDDAGAKRVRIERGEVRCEVAHQPPGQAMRLLSEHGEAEIIGTRFTLRVEQAQTRLDVSDGTVSLRRADGKAVTVHAGYRAIAGAGIPLQALPLAQEQSPERPIRPSAARLSGDTSQPDHSCFIAGQPVALTFHAAGLAQSARDQLLLRVEDEHRLVLEEREVPVNADAAGEWRQAVSVPHQRLGFYRVAARLASGATLPQLESRPAGSLTYVVLPDPAQRPQVAMENAFFGIVSLPSEHATLPALLGSRWLPLGRWAAECPEQPLAAIPPQTADWPRYPDGTAWLLHPAFAGIASAEGASWRDQVFVGDTWRLIPDSGEQIFSEHCAAVAQARMRDFPGLPQRIYQIWEPLGEQITAEELTQIHRIAHRAIHRVDAQAVVIGPGFGLYTNLDRRPTFDQLHAAGLFDHLDGLSLHLYLDNQGRSDAEHAPETVTPSLPQAIRDLRAWMRERLGRELPLYGTEQGFRATADPLSELEQARHRIHSDLILLGEGLVCNWAFIGSDFRGDPGYGFTYALGPDFSSEQVGPRPMAAAYAAMTFLLEGRKRVRPLSGLGATGMGYAYGNGDDEVLAVWDRGDGPHPVELALGVAEVTVYDWMGNGRQMTTDGGVLRLELGSEPVYIATGR